MSSKKKKNREVWFVTGNFDSNNPRKISVVYLSQSIYYGNRMLPKHVMVKEDFKKIAYQQKECVTWGLEQKLRSVVLTCGSVF